MAPTRVPQHKLRLKTVRRKMRNESQQSDMPDRLLEHVKSERSPYAAMQSLRSAKGSPPVLTQRRACCQSTDNPVGVSDVPCFRRTQNLGKRALVRKA